MRAYDLGGHGAYRWCRSTVRKIWHILCVCVSQPVTLTFDLLTLKLVRNVARVIGYPPPANFGDTTTIQTDRVTLTLRP